MIHPVGGIVIEISTVTSARGLHFFCPCRVMVKVGGKKKKQEGVQCLGWEGQAGSCQYCTLHGVCCYAQGTTLRLLYPLKNDRMTAKDKVKLAERKKEITASSLIPTPMYKPGKEFRFFSCEHGAGTPE